MYSEYKTLLYILVRTSRHDSLRNRLPSLRNGRFSFQVTIHARRHFNLVLVVSFYDSRPLVVCESLILTLMHFSELHIRRRPWSAENSANVLKIAMLIKRSMAILLAEFLRMEKLSCGFSARHEKDVISRQTCRVC